MIEGRISPTAKLPERHHAPIAQAREAALRTVHLLSLVDGEGTFSTSLRGAGSVTATDLDIARRVVRKRADRDTLFGTGIFTDPAWDVLLDLFIAGEAGQKVSISSVCIAARVPATTALRSLKDLESRKIIAREADEHDRRRSFIALTAESRSKISALLRDLNAGLL